MADLKAYVELALGGNYNSAIKAAGESTNKFAKGAEAGLGKLKTAQEKIVGGFDKIARSADALAGPLGTLAAGLSLGAASKQLIDFDAQVTALGVQAGKSDKEIAQFKKDVFSTATDTNIKLPVDELAAAAAVIVDMTGHFDYASESLHTMGLAMRAMGMEGTAAGGFFALFDQWGVKGEALDKNLATMMAIADQGAFTAKAIGNLGTRVFPSLLSAGRSKDTAFIEATQAMELIRPVSGSDEQAVTRFQALVRNIKNPSKELKKLNVDLDLSKRSIVDIMADLVKASEKKKKSLDMDAEATAALALLQTEYKQSVDGTMPSSEKYKKICADIEYVEDAAGRKAKTLSANIENLKTNVLAGFISALTPALEGLNRELNKLAENPEKLQKTFTVVAVGLGSIVAVKGLASAAKSVQTLSGIWGKGGKSKLDVMQTLSAPGAQGLPVYVTNLGAAGSLGGGGGRGRYGKKRRVAGVRRTGSITGRGGRNPARTRVPKAPAASVLKKSLTKPAPGVFKNALKKAKAPVVGAGVVEGAFAAWDMIQDFQEINNSGESERDKTLQKGAAIGEAVGKIGGAVAGMAAGAALGSVIPVFGTALGGLAGFIIGGILSEAGSELFGKAGNVVGGKLTEWALNEKEKEAPIVTEELLAIGRGNQYASAMLMDLKNAQSSRKGGTGRQRKC